MTPRLRGTVLWLDCDLEFGTIRPDERGPDVFFELEAIASTGHVVLEPSQRVEFELRAISSGRRPEAARVWFPPRRARRAR